MKNRIANRIYPNWVANVDAALGQLIEEGLATISFDENGEEVWMLTEEGKEAAQAVLDTQKAPLKDARAALQKVIDSDQARPLLELCGSMPDV